MGAYDVFNSIQSKWLQYSTPVANVWWAINVVFRGFVVLGIGDNVYGDEGNFECSTQDPGCQMLCFNEFNPMTMPRFWSFQFLFCSFPAFLFILIATNQTAQIEKIEKELEDMESERVNGDIEAGSDHYVKKYNKLMKQKKKVGFDKMKKKRTTDNDGLHEVIWTPKIKVWKVITLGLGVLMEIVFLYFFYLLQTIINGGKFGFAALAYPDKYYCQVGQREGEGCFSHKKADVPCYISRPTEKEIVMWYMITVSLCSIALVIAEFFWLFGKVSVERVKDKRERRQEMKKLMLTPALALSGYESGQLSGKSSRRRNHSPTRSHNGIP